MHDGAAHLVDRVLPHLNYRQWVFTVPKWLRAPLVEQAAAKRPASGAQTTTRDLAPATTPTVPRARRLPWAALLQRVYAIDVFVCTGCGGRRRIIAAITQPAFAVAILTHLGLENPSDARAPPSPSPNHLDDYAIDAPSPID